MIFIFCFDQAAFAVDVLDVFKFHRDTQVQLQQDVSLYDPSQPHGVISPFTSYIGRLVSKLGSVKRLSDLPELGVPVLKPGEFSVEYVDPKKMADIQDQVVRRNYVGVKEFFVVRENLDRVFRMVTDYDHLDRLLPGMEVCRIVDRKANRVNVENWRRTEASVFGKRKNYYLTANIFSLGNGKNRRMIKSQLLKGDNRKIKYQGTVFMDSLWYFEACGEQCTQVFYMGFSLLGWDYMRTPAFFPFVSKEVRKQLVAGVIEGGARSSLAFLIKCGDPRFKNRSLSDFSQEDKRLISQEVESRLEKLRKEGRIKVDWETVFD